jgi:hypothetical protein
LGWMDGWTDVFLVVVRGVWRSFVMIRRKCVWRGHVAFDKAYLTVVSLLLLVAR